MITPQHKFAKFRIFIMAILLGSGLKVNAQFEIPEEQPSFTADYVNSMFYYSNLDHLRSSFNRISSLESLESNNGKSKSNFKRGAVIYDFNYGRNVMGKPKVPMLVGASGMYKQIGFHALISTTHMRMFGGGESWEENYVYDLERFSGSSFGLSYNNKWFNVLGDVTYAQKNLSFFGQFNIPVIKLRAGIGISKYNQIIDSLGYTTIIQGDRFTPDYYFVNSSILKFINVGFSVLSFSEVRLSPHLSFSLYQLYNRNRWSNLKFDVELYLKTQTPGIKEVFEMQDYEARCSFYFFAGADFGSSSDETASPIATRGAFFTSISYKSGTDYIAQTMQNAGISYKGPTGWGGEIGYGIRVLGLRNYGIDDETFLKVSLYYNYSAYFDVWPALIGGIKFRVKI